MIDLEKMKSKLTDINSSENSGGVNFYKPSDGQQYIRILPLETGDPFPEFFFHYNVGRGSLVCPKETHGDDCPICDYVDTLWDSYNETKDESIKSLALDIKCKSRFYSVVIDREDEAAGPKVYGYSKTVAGAFLGLVLDDDYGDITNPYEGNDIKLTYGKKNGQSWPSTDVMARPVKTRVFEDEEKIQSALDNRPDLSRLFTVKPKEEIMEALDEFMSEMSGDVEESNDSSTGKEHVPAEGSPDEKFAELKAELAELPENQE